MYDTNVTAPEVIRAPKEEKIDIVYSEDPALKERNKQLGEELERLALSEMNANLRMQNIAREYDLLKEKFLELEKLSKVPRTVYIERKVTEEVEKHQRIGNEVDKVLDMYEKNRMVRHK